MRRFMGLRWLTIGLIMLGAMVNFLSRQTLSIAAPTVIADLHITTQQYGWITSAFQGGIMLQPVVGYIIDILGVKSGFALFAFLWSVICAAHGLASSWQILAGLRGLLGFAEGAFSPGGLKVVSEWFPSKERGLAGGLYNIGPSLGSMLAPPLVAWAILNYSWQASFVIVGAISLSWVALWLIFYHPVSSHPGLSQEEREHIISGQEFFLQAQDKKPSILSILKRRNFWGIALPRFFTDPTWFMLSFWVPLYLTTVRGFDLKQIAMYAWLPFLAADLGCIFGPAVVLFLQKRGLDLIDARRCAFTLGAFLMIGVAFTGTVQSAYMAVALLCLAGFAHQTLSVTMITMATDLFPRNEVGTVAGMAGTCANFGGWVSALLIGGLVSTIGYSPFFVGLAVLDLVAAAVAWDCDKETGMSIIQNPILRGFNPDPSILRVGEDYYIATSTFEWFPGVQIHHSKDLKNWRLLTRPLRRASQLNMLGDADSCGIWAPCLSHDGDQFYLIYTDVKRYGRASVGGASGASLRDFHNYMVTAKTIDGDWSDPIYINSSGFDPSLFHDDDGRKWLVNMLWDHRPGQNRFAGIVAQEYSRNEMKLIGERVNIFKGTPLGFTEAPHLYKRDGWYYLLTAEGGTAWNHAVTMARSRNLLGPYELHPDTTIISARDRPDAPLQRAGHADLVETPEGDTYIVYLCGRPLRNRGRCTLGRETAIQKMQWRDGWLYTEGEAGVPQLTTPAPKVKEHPFSAAPARDDFESPELGKDFQWLRTPHPETIFSLTARPGHLRLYGRESIGSLFTQALVARRQQSHCYSAQTILDFEPAHFQQAAGLICYYGGNKFHYLHVTHDESHGKHIRVMSALPDAPVGDAFTAPIVIPSGPVGLRVEVDEERLYFAYRLGHGPWQRMPQSFDASILSDEAQTPGSPNFTGAFVGMACQDMAGTAAPADFDYFTYVERAFRADPFATA